MPVRVPRILPALALAALSCAPPSKPVEAPRPAPPKPVGPSPTTRAELVAPLEGIRIRARVARSRAGATFSSDGRFLVQGPLVREVVSGDVVRLFPGIGSSSAISRDGMLFAVGEERKIVLYEMATGKPIRTFDLSEPAKRVLNGNKHVTRLAFSDDDKNLVAYVSKTIVVQPVAGGTPRVVHSACSTHEDACGLVTSDARYAVEPGRGTDSNDDGLVMTDLLTGRSSPSIPAKQMREAARVAAANRVAAMLAMDGTVALFDLEKHKRTRLFDVSPMRYEMATVGTTGETVGTRSAKEYPLDMALSPDGKRLYTVGTPDGDDAMPVLRAWDTQTGTAAFSLRMPTYMPEVAVSPDGATVAMSGPTSTYLYDVRQRRFTARITDAIAQVRAVAASADGRWAATGSDETVTLWDMTRLRVARSWNVASPTKTPKNAWGNHVTALGFSTDGKRIAVGTYAGAAVIVETETGRLVRDLQPVYRSETEKRGSHWIGIYRLAFSDDGALVAATDAHGKVVVHAIASGEKAEFGSAPWLPKPTYDAFVAESKTGVRNVPDAAQYKQLGDGVLLAERGSARLSMCKTGGVCLHSDKGDATSGPDFPASPSGAAILGDDRAMVSFADGSVRLFAIGQKDPLTMVSAGDDWAMFTDDGLFDASPRGDRLLYVIEGDHAASIEQIAPFNNRADILLERFGRAPDDVARLRARHEQRARRLGILARKRDEAAPDARIVKRAVEGNVATIEAELAAPASGTLSGYRVFVDNVPLSVAPKPATGATARVTETIALTQARSRIEIEAISASGRTSARAVAVVDGTAATSRELYFVGLGVSAYKVRELELGSADKDAKALARHFVANPGRYAATHVQTWTDAEVGHDVTSRVKAFVEKARPKDTVVFFIAGHGVHDRDAAATYYYLPHDVDPKDLAKTAIPFDALEDALASSPARTRVLLMDTCASGEAEEDARVTAGVAGARVRGARGLVLAAAPKRTVVEKDRFAYVDLVRRAGAIVVSSSHGGEPSLENDTLGHGLFTAALLDALGKRGADTDKSGALSREELFSFVRDAVTKASAGSQNPTIDRDNLAVDLDLPVVR